ncbi:MAG: aspartate aminotransferase family protein [Bacteroidales bacterium]|nr:aspartate aminotransferase family protein [Bacteroidales bacterium]
MSSTRHLFFEHCAQTSPMPLTIEINRAKGLHLFDVNGKSYLDLISGIAVSNVGHCHPKVVAAVQKQAETFMHLMVYGEYVQSPQVKLAEKLASLLPQNLSCTYFTNSGSEAIEGAIKLARKYSQKSEIISCHNSYHGSTLGALSIIGDDEYRSHFEPLLPNTKRIRHGIIEDLSLITDKTAVVVIEAIQAEAGIYKASKEYWTALQQKCKETQTLIVCDEIQTGFGRTGTMFGFQNVGIQPDIITLAKGFGGGMPIGAFVSSKEIMQTFTTNPILGHMTTFGGHPVCCAAALATIEVIENEKLVNNIPFKAEAFKSLIQHPSLIKDFRQEGLMMAIEFESFEINKKIIDLCLENRIITDWFLFNSKSMRIAPPLVITIEEIEEACSVINRVLKQI